MENLVINKIEQWIDQTLIDYSSEKKSCECFSSQFNGFYPIEFLSQSSFVVVDVIPKPDFPELRQAGLGKFIDMDAYGITYKNTYFVKREYESDLALHFHELVHVLQWQYLGATDFIIRYISEVQQHGYEAAPLEIMAYGLQDHYSSNREALDIPSYVQNKI